MRKHYPGIVERDRDSNRTLGVWFPDLPGCVTVGQSLDEAYRNAGEALQFHIDGLVEDGDPISSPDWANVEKHARDDEDSVLVAVIAVPVDVTTKAKRINITIDETLLSRIDQHASALGVPRSTFLAEAARALLRSEQDRTPD